jgi:hypothetical protein
MSRPQENPAADAGFFFAVQAVFHQLYYIQNVLIVPCSRFFWFLSFGCPPSISDVDAEPTDPDKR